MGLGFRRMYIGLVPAIAAAAAIVGYYTWGAASQFADLGAETIVQSLFLLADEKVRRIEQVVIRQDNAVFNLIDPSDPASVARDWLPAAKDVSPSVKAALILDANRHVVAYTMRGSSDDREEFQRVFRKRILRELGLEHLELERLTHHHRRYDGRSYLLSYKATEHLGEKYFLIALHDAGYIVRTEFPTLFATEAGKNIYSVIDEETNRSVYGPSLVGAGDYLIGMRFPSTLYSWRLQVAPTQAPLLETKSRSGQVTQTALIAVSFSVIILGITFLFYAANKERRLNALKGEFVANVSHELKTPLSVIRMFSEMLLTRRVRSEEKASQYLEQICRESERLSALIENVLDFAAVEGGKRKYELRVGDLREVAQRAVEALRYRVEEGLEIQVVSENPIGAVVMDEQAMMLAVVNLLDNAVKYGASTPIELVLEQKNTEVILSVRDGGPGIPEEDLRRVFERFYRARTNAHTRGSGIGLSLVKSIAEAHGGRAWAQNAAGGGALVSIALPSATPTVQAAEVAPAATHS